MSSDPCIKIYIRPVPGPEEEPDPSVIRTFLSERRRFLERAPKEAASGSYAAGILLRDVLKIRNDEDLFRTSSGKPVLSDHTACFSLSHSRSFAVLAVCPVKIGVDTEDIRPLRPSLIDRVFTEEERAFLEKDPEQNGMILWTRLEAALKYSGKGLGGIRESRGPLLSGTGPLYFHTKRIGSSFISTACASDLRTEYRIFRGNRLFPLQK